MSKNTHIEDDVELSPLQKELGKEWDKMYGRFLEDTSDLIKKAGGHKKLKIQIVINGEAKDIDLSNLLLVF